MLPSICEQEEFLMSIGGHIFHGVKTKNGICWMAKWCSSVTTGTGTHKVPFEKFPQFYPWLMIIYCDKNRRRRQRRWKNEEKETFLDGIESCCVVLCVE